jgi:hypothetical protein
VNRWTTHVEIPGFPQQITYRNRLLLIGSCFADHIGQALLQRRFHTTVNPFGTVYNPLSIANSLQRLQCGEPFTDADVIKSGEVYTTFFHHSRFAHPDKHVFLQRANEALRQGAQAFAAADFVILSLGTAWVYRDKDTAQVVNNCHKLPAARFERLRLTADDVVDALSAATAQPGKRWIITVSPIRHWKDGAHANQLSKAALLLAVEQVQQTAANVAYFPAYEIMMDELRDYRFYADDMHHPSAQAVSYIWERFAHTAFSDKTKKIIREAEKISKAQNHRPLHPDTAAYEDFQKKLAQQIADFDTLTAADA